MSEENDNTPKEVPPKDAGTASFLSSLTKTAIPVIHGVKANYALLYQNGAVKIGIRPVLVPGKVGEALYLCLGVKLRLEGVKPKTFASYASEAGEHRGAIIGVPMFALPNNPALAVKWPEYLDNLVIQLHNTMTKEGLAPTLSMENTHTYVYDSMEEQFPVNSGVWAPTDAPMVSIKG